MVLLSVSHVGSEPLLGGLVGLQNVAFDAIAAGLCRGKLLEAGRGWLGRVVVARGAWGGPVWMRGRVVLTTLPVLISTCAFLHGGILALGIIALHGVASFVTSLGEGRNYVR
jgi:hypothetical protein